MDKKLSLLVWHLIKSFLDLIVLYIFLIYIGMREKMQDGNREIRSMVMVSFPIPPLPLIVCKEMEDELSFVHSDHTVASSHDLVAHLMNVTCVVASSSANAQRMKRQEEIMNCFFDNVDSHKEEVNHSEEWCYKAAAEFTRLYAASYMQKLVPVDMRFVAASDIDRNHKVFHRMIEFQKAQDILYGPIDSGEKLEEMTFGQLVQHSFRRILAAGLL